MGRLVERSRPPGDFKCQCCGLNRAAEKDLRADNYGNVTRFWVCRRCLWLDDDDFSHIMEADSRASQIRKVLMLNVRHGTKEEDDKFLRKCRSADDDGDYEFLGIRGRNHAKEGRA